MTEKIDLREKDAIAFPPGEYPPEIQQLIEKHGSASAAEKAAKIYASYFGRVRKGSEKYTAFYQSKVLAALNGTPMPDDSIARGFVPPRTCPDLLVQLLRHTGSKKQTAKALGTSEAYVYAMIDGSKDMIPAHITRAKAALGLPVIYSQRDEVMEVEKPPVATLPPFVPWDGKAKGSLAIAGRGGKKGRTVKNVAQPLIDVVQKYGGVNPAASAMGSSGNSITNIIENPDKFNDKWQRKVHAAMHGEIHREQPMGEAFDKYTLGIAICLLKGAAYDHIATIAEILNARLCFKKSTSAGWILIYKMKDDDLPKFKKIAMRDANEIVCP